MLHINWLVVIVTLVLPLRISVPVAQTPAARLDILSVDHATLPELEITVQVRDAFGRGMADLGSSQWQIEEDGRVVPPELIDVAPVPEQAAPVTVAIVADLSSLFKPETQARMRADLAELIERTMRADQIEMALFAPRSGDQPLVAQPWSADAATVQRSVTDTAPRTGQTDLYNAVLTATNAVADRAAQRGGPALVLVLGDGGDRTSIVGANSAGADQAARVASERRVQLLTLAYPATPARDGNILAQLADRTGGVAQLAGAPGALERLAQQVIDNRAGGTYRLRYRSALPSDGADHPLMIQAQPAAAPALTSQRHVRLPRAWNAQRTTHLQIQLDSAAYPNVTLMARPINGQRRTVADLTPDQITLVLNGQPLNVPLQLRSVPLAANDPRATQSVALVVEQNGVTASRLHELAEHVLQAPDLAATPLAVFVPGVPPRGPQFTTDHNSLLNVLNAVEARDEAGSSLGASLLLAIEAAARDADAAQRPAHVVLASSTPLSADDYSRALTLAQERSVTIQVLALDQAATDGRLERLARATQGRLVANPNGAAINTMAAQIGADRATAYAIRFDAPLVADGEARPLMVHLDDQTATTTLTPVIAGAVVVRPPVSTATQVLLAVVIAGLLAASAVVPRVLRERRLRCSTCGRVRRASWGTACLFCEHAAQARPVDDVPPVPLDGFAQQGVALAQPSAHSIIALAAETNVPDGARSTMLEDDAAPEPSALSAREATNASVATLGSDHEVDHTGFWGAVDQSTHLETGRA